MEYFFLYEVLKHINILGIIEKYYVILCLQCGREIATSNRGELVNKVRGMDICIKCDKRIEISASDVIVGYKIIQELNISS